MKRIVKYGLPVVLLVIGGVAYMTVAEEDASGLNREDKTFIIETAHARMMDWSQGNLAAEKGTSGRYRQYGKRMMRDQSKLMDELKVLAANKNIVLSEELSEEKAEELTKLKACSGESFDRRFRRTIIKDHKRDIHLFKQASESTDPEIREFAKRHLPLLEDHLQAARDLNQ